MQEDTRTSESLQAEEEELIFLREASRVNRSRKQVKEKGPETIETYGQNILELYEKYNRPMLLARTLLASSRWMMAKYLTGYFLIWRVKVTKSNRSLFQLAVSKRGTAGKESGLWAIPQARDHKSPKRVNSKSPYPMLNEQVHKNPAGVTPTHHVPTPTATDHIERKSTNTGGPSKGELNYNTNKSVSLDRCAKMFPTPHANCHTGAGEHGEGGPNLQTVTKMFPTPVETMYKGWSPGHNRANTDDRLDYTIEREAGKGGTLNPQWVEWLMGFPIGWTDLKD